MTEHQRLASSFPVRPNPRAGGVAGALAAAAFLLAACAEPPSSGADDANVAGAASLLLEGSVQQPTAQVALAWSSYSGPVAGVLVAVDEVGAYSLEATQAPPSYAFDSSLGRMLAEEGLPDPRIADAVVVGLSAGVEGSPLDATRLESVMLEAIVVYVEEDLEGDSFAGLLYGPLGRGYHLLQLIPGPTRTIWAKSGEICTTDEDDRCAPDEARGASGMSVDGWMVPIAFEEAPPLVAAGSR